MRNIQEQLKEYQPTKTVYIVFNQGFKKCEKKLIEQVSYQDLTDAFLQCFKHANEQNYNNILILEDDCGFNENVLNLESYYKQLPEDYSVFYLGYDCPFTGPYSSNLNVSTGSVGWTHSMNVRKHCAEKILEINSDLLWTADGAFAQLHNTDGTQYHLAVPQITYQDNDGTTSTLVEVDKQYGMGF
jgi:hypothetical protein